MGCPNLREWKDIHVEDGPTEAGVAPVEAWSHGRNVVGDHMLWGQRSTVEGAFQMPGSYPTWQSVGASEFELWPSQAVEAHSDF